MPYEVDQKEAAASSCRTCVPDSIIYKKSNVPYEVDQKDAAASCVPGRRHFVITSAFCCTLKI